VYESELLLEKRGGVARPKAEIDDEGCRMVEYGYSKLRKKTGL